MVFFLEVIRQIAERHGNPMKRIGGAIDEEKSVAFHRHVFDVFIFVAVERGDVVRQTGCQSATECEEQGNDFKLHGLDENSHPNSRQGQQKTFKYRNSPFWPL